MSREKEIHVFIVEDLEVAQRLVKEHFAPGGSMTFAAIVDEDKRQELVDAINEIA